MQIVRIMMAAAALKERLQSYPEETLKICFYTSDLCS